MLVNNPEYRIHKHKNGFVVERKFKCYWKPIIKDTLTNKVKYYETFEAAISDYFKLLRFDILSNSDTC
jgi:hypothetical protein